MRLNVNFFIKIHRLIYTVKYLKYKQIYNRIYRKIKKVKCCNEIEFTKRQHIQQFIHHPLLANSHIENDKFCFLNKIGSYKGWNSNSYDKLWLYNLHYFDFINSINHDSDISWHESIILEWINENQFMHGNGWEPYPLSLRIVNWIKWILRNNISDQKINSSLYHQSDALFQSLEYHLLGNHLFSNSKALIFSGCYFDGKVADNWLLKGLQILDKEIKEQILDDGGNFELSPMYHNIMLTDMLDLYNLSQCYQHPDLIERAPSWKKIIERMLQYSEAISHPDGEVSFFNDSAIGVAPNISCLLDYASQLFSLSNLSLNANELDKTDSWVHFDHFQNSGYIIVESSKQKTILDVANVGPDYIPGHAHADTLSFEMSISGERVFVNSGTGEYGISDERLRQRKTAAHNTVEVDGKDSSEVWSGFRVARRAYPSRPFIKQSENILTVSCSHNGYHRLPGKVTHRRQWDFTDDLFKVTDNLDGQYKKALAYYHIHPEIEVTVRGKQALLKLKCGKQVIVDASEEISIESTTWHPQFGISIPSKKLVIPFSSSQIDVTIRF